ncbi:MAG: hypothetical protein KGL37_00560 [Acidobacteriota bacterium]|nr:hypothetical protein [Acidobacteriota bacterium]
MGSLSQSAAVRPLPAITGRNGLIDRYFYFSMSLLMAAIVVWGFSHTIDRNLLHPTVPPPLILWIHGAVFSGWVAFFIFQSALVRTHNVRWHRVSGWFGAGLGAAMAPLGVATAMVMTRFETYRLHEVGRSAFMIVPMYAMLEFATILTLAVCWRKKPELHRRLIFIATCVLLGAAFGRFPYLYQHHAFFAGIDLLILLGVTRDLLVNRRVHGVYLTVLPLLMATQIFVVYTWLSGAGWWLRIAHAMLG